LSFVPIGKSLFDEERGDPHGIVTPAIERHRGVRRICSMRLLDARYGNSRVVTFYVAAEVVFGHLQTSGNRTHAPSRSFPSKRENTMTSCPGAI